MGRPDGVVPCRYAVREEGDGEGAVGVVMVALQSISQRSTALGAMQSNVNKYSIFEAPGC